MKTLKIHQYNEKFILDLRFWVEVKDDDVYRTSWIRNGTKFDQVNNYTGLIPDNDKITTFYFNKNLSE